MRQTNSCRTEESGKRQAKTVRHTKGDKHLNSLSDILKKSDIILTFLGVGVCEQKRQSEALQTLSGLYPLRPLVQCPYYTC